MTTIAYRNGILAADSRAFAGGPDYIGEKTKIFTKDGNAVAVSSTKPGYGERFARWLLNDGAENEMPTVGEGASFTALVIIDGEVFIYENSPYPTGPLMAEFFAIGSGDRYAMGAMEMGASAAEAVRVAAKFDIWTGGTIRIKDISHRAL